MDPLVRSASLKALSRSRATPALLDIAASLSDPEPDVRSQAIIALTALSPASPVLTKLITPLLDDESALVSTQAALSLLLLDKANGKAKAHLRQVAVLGETEDRIHAIQAMGEWGDREAFDFLTNELKDEQIEPAIKRALLTALARINAHEATPYLLGALKDPSVRDASAQLLGGIGVSVTDKVIGLLNDDASADGALLTFEHLPPPPPKPILDFARMAVSLAGEYDALRRGIQATGENEAKDLLEESLHAKSHQYGIRALRAVGLLGSRDAMNLAIENLQARDSIQRADVLEALDSISAKHRGVVRPLTKLWEEEAVQSTVHDSEPVWDRLLSDPDEWIRECAAFAKNYGETMDTLATLSLMDRIIFLKRVPLFSNLSPVDLKQVASIAEEEFFNDGEEITHEGDAGDVMFIIVSGEVKVCSEKDGHEVEIARRKAGDYVGEMSIIGREPRMASLVAVGDVRTLCIDQKSFEGLIRERPDVSLAVMKVLSQRLKEASLKK
jgi:HEAT repeat protein